MTSGANVASQLLAPSPGADAAVSHSTPSLQSGASRTPFRRPLPKDVSESVAQRAVTAHRAAHHETRLRPGRACAPLRRRKARARAHTDENCAPLRQQRRARRSARRRAPRFVLARGSLGVVGNLLPAQALPHLAHLRTGFTLALSLPYPIQHGLKPPSTDTLQCSAAVDLRMRKRMCRRAPLQRCRAAARSGGRSRRGCSSRARTASSR